MGRKSATSESDQGGEGEKWHKNTGDHDNLTMFGTAKGRWCHLMFYPHVRGYFLKMQFLFGFKILKKICMHASGILNTHSHTHSTTLAGCRSEEKQEWHITGNGSTTMEQRKGGVICDNEVELLLNITTSDTRHLSSV